MGMQNIPGCRKGQGATEYLVLLAVVLIVALVSVALLGFFPGMASDAQATQSKMYWSGASPIAITEWAARYTDASGTGRLTTVPYFRIRNTGNYPITITKMFAGIYSLSYVWTSNWYPVALMSTRYTLGPGEESDFVPISNSANYFGAPDPGSGNRRFVTFTDPESYAVSYEAQFNKGAAKSYCTHDPPYGYLVIENFGFEYTEYIEGQTITKRQVGAKPVVIKCMNNYN